MKRHITEKIKRLGSAPRLLPLLVAVAASTALGGCIRDDISACPNLNIAFGVKDRLYDNAADVSYTDPNETSTFSALIPEMCFILTDKDGKIVRGQHLQHTHGDELDTIEFDETLPFGKYTLTAWGAIDTEDALGDNPRTLDLTGLNHDVFTVTADIDYSYDKALVHADFMRATGMVIVETEWETFPVGINASEKVFSGLSSSVSAGLEYESEQELTIAHSWETSSIVTSKTVLPPSVSENSTRLHIRYFDPTAPDSPGIVPEDVRLTVRRNAITRLRYKFDPYSKSVTISTMVDGRWQQINGMHVD